MDFGWSATSAYWEVNMSSVVTRAMLVAALAGFSVISQAQAALINNGTGLAAPLTTITFDEIVLADQTELLATYAAYGVTFGAGVRYGTVDYAIPNTAPPNAVNFFGFVDPWIVRFDDPLSEAAMVVATNTSQPNTVITALLGGGVVESFNIATSQGGATNFFGFTGIVFDEIRVSNPASGIVVDNIQLGRAVAVPEPASLLLLSSALVLLGGMRVTRRRRA